MQLSVKKSSKLNLNLREFFVVDKIKRFDSLVDRCYPTTHYQLENKRPIRLLDEWMMTHMHTSL